VLRTYKFRLYPSPDQVDKLVEWLECACRLYNAALQTVKDPYVRTRRHRYKFWDDAKNDWVWKDARPSIDGQERSADEFLDLVRSLGYRGTIHQRAVPTDPKTWGKDLTEVGRQYPELFPESMPVQVRHEVLARVQRTRGAMFARKAEGKKVGTPRYRKRHQYRSVTVTLTAPSRPPKDRDDEWLIEHGPNLVDAIEHTRRWIADGKDYAKVTAKELQKLVGLKTFDEARFLRVLTFESLDLEVPEGITAGAGRIDDNTLYVAGLGSLPLLRKARRRGVQQGRRVHGMRQHRPFPDGAIPRSVIISRSCGRWYACIALELPDPIPTADQRPAVGVDLGLITPWTLYCEDRKVLAEVSKDLKRQTVNHVGARKAKTPVGISHLVDGFAIKIDGAKAAEKHARRVTLWQQMVSRRTRRGHSHSHRQRKAVQGLARAKERERNLRADYRHRITRVIANRFGNIAMEKLSVRQMVRAPRNEPDWEGPARLKEDLNRRIHGEAWYQDRLCTTYKAEEAGGLVWVEPAEHSTDTCSECGILVPMPPLMRWFKCPSCGYSVPRTTNSARNMLLRMRADVMQRQSGGTHPSGRYGNGRSGLRTSQPLTSSEKPRGSTSRVRQMEGG